VPTQREEGVVNGMVFPLCWLFEISILIITIRLMDPLEPLPGRADNSSAPQQGGSNNQLNNPQPQNPTHDYQ
jgi:hypothetical protein